MTTRVTTPDILGDIMTGATAAVVAPITVPLAAIVNDGGTQMRAGMDAATITEYEEAIKGADGWPFPPVVVFHDGEKYWLADGFHRVNAAHRSGKHTAIPAEVKAGTRRDAILYAAGANASHGLRRTNGDKQRSVDVMLRDAEWSQWSNSEIARRCIVDEKMVRTMRDRLVAASAIPKLSQRLGADGKSYNTQNIGANRPAQSGVMPKYTVEELRGMVRACAVETGMTPAGEQTPFWQKLQVWMAHHGKGTLWSVSDLRAALDQVIRQNAKDAPIVATDDLHAGAGRTAPPAMTVAELVEDLDGYLTGIPAAEIDAAARGANNRALQTAQTCLSDFTYRQADLYRALQRLALQRGAAATASTSSATEGAAEPVVNGDRPLPGWAAVVEVHGESAPVAEFFELPKLPSVPADLAAAGWELRINDYARYFMYNVHTTAASRSRLTPAQAFETVRGLMAGRPISTTVNQHPQHEELTEFSELFKLSAKEVRKWGALTGLHTEVLEAERGLRHLIERTESILKDFDHAAE